MAVSRLLMVLVVALGGLSASAATEMDRLKVQRKDVFEFTARPTLARVGDTVTISFAVKDYCDVTVAIEEGDGPSKSPGQAKILRHLVSRQV